MNRIAALLVALGAGACSEGLKYRIDDGYLAAVPPDDRKGIAAAEKDLGDAKKEREFAESQLDTVRRDREIAEKEKLQAETELEKNKLEREAAEKAHDPTLVNTANRNKAVAGLGIKTVEAKLDHLSAKESWAETSARVAKARAGAAEARIELEKATVCQKKGITPGDEFVFGEYELQWKDRDDELAAARKKLTDDERRAKDTEQKWKKLEGELGVLKGTK